MKKRFILLLLVCISFACSSPDDTKKLPSELRGYPLVSGHRGANDIAPENTFASADSCIRYHIDVMETDVKISSDSVFYILHDWKLDRTTNGKGYLYERNSSYIDKLDAGSWFGDDWKGQKVPRFQSLLRKARKAGLQITVDYKDGDIGKLVELIEAEGMLQDTYFTFSKDEDVIAFRARYPEIRTLQAYCRNPEDMDEVLSLMDPDIVVCQIRKITPEMVRRCHEKRVQVLALILGLDDMTEWNRKAVELGVDVVATDRPKAFREQFDYAGKGL